MDVSGWTVEQRMRLPDWCFGNRDLMSLYIENVVAGTYTYAISAFVLPDPACIWGIMFMSTNSVAGLGYVRLGLNDHLPVDAADMNTSIEILPNFGRPAAGPNIFWISGSYFYVWDMPAKRGLVTNGWNFVIENRCVVADFRVDVTLIVSGLPTDMAGWLAHNKV